MNRWLKISFVIFLVIVLVILLDSFIALVFDSNMIIGIETRNMKKVGILVDTYHCGNGKNDTVIKGFSYSCSYRGGDYVLVDETKNKVGFMCVDAVSIFYEDDRYIYYWNCMKNQYMLVKYNGGSSELISDAIKAGHIDIEVLDKFNIDYYKQEK